ncbi:hypothetical protein J5690_08870 [bacterium]|nr:hypothetical protein [bacterium]
MKKKQVRFCIFWKKATGILQTDTLLYRKPSKRRKREADRWRWQPIDLFYARFQKDLLFFHQAFAEFECPLAILRKYGFVTKVLCFAVEPGEVVTAEVIRLKRIRGKQCLAMVNCHFIVLDFQLIDTSLNAVLRSRDQTRADTGRGEANALPRCVLLEKIILEQKKACPAA